MKMNFFSNILNQLLLQPHTLLLKWGSTDENLNVFDGNKINHEVGTVQANLKANKVQVADKVLIGLPLSPDSVFAILGVMAYGAIPVTPPARIKKLDLLKLLKEEKIKNVYLKKPGFVIKTVALSKGIKIVEHITRNESKTSEVNLPWEDMPALVSFTSGSTGKSNAVHRTHKVLTAQHLALKKSFGTHDNHVDLPLFPNILLHNLSLGIPTVMPDLPTFNLAAMNAQKILHQLKSEDITSLTGNVFYYKKLLEQLKLNPQVFTRVNALGIGGSPVPEILALHLTRYFPNAQLYIIYGSTQAEPIAIRNFKDPKPPEMGYYVGTIHDDLQLKLKTVLHTSTSDGKNAGEICVKGDHVVCDSNDGWLHTGDFGYIGTNNQLYLIARKGNEQLVAGYGHYQIEHVLLCNDLVSQVAALATSEGFQIYYVGSCENDDIVKQLRIFPLSIIKSIKKVESLPVDDRHFSKILYKQVCKQYLEN